MRAGCILRYVAWPKIYIKVYRADILDGKIFSESRLKGGRLWRRFYECEWHVTFPLFPAARFIFTKYAISNTIRGSSGSRVQGWGGRSAILMFCVCRHPCILPVDGRVSSDDVGM